MGKARNGRAGCVFFTLIELLVVITIITILAAMLMPALQRARRHIWSTFCLFNFRHTGMAYNMYAADYNDSVPRPTWGDVMYDRGEDPGHGRAGLTPWRTPYIPVGRGVMYDEGYIEAIVLFCPANMTYWEREGHKFFPALAGSRVDNIGTVCRFAPYSWTAVPDGWGGSSRHLPHFQESGVEGYWRWHLWPDRAIVTDHVSKEYDLPLWSSNHESNTTEGISGWNILYGDGSVIWHDLTAVRRWWDRSYDPGRFLWSSTLPSHGRYFLSTYRAGTQRSYPFWDVADLRR